MIDNDDLRSELHKLDPDTRVDLYELDASNVGVSSIYRFTTTKTDEPLTWSGASFPYFPAEVSGYELTAQGSLPEPTISVPVVLSPFAGLVVSAGDLLGATLIRYRTFARFLDDGATPDATAVMPADVYTIEQKTSHTKTYITFKLAAALDKQGWVIPRRQSIKNICTHTYRKWDVTLQRFDYTGVTCPYTGTSKYTLGDEATTLAIQDACGKRITSCKLRFGATAELPTRAFPGLTRVG
jgi:lambda family phage minor tail protein L